MTIRISATLIRISATLIRISAIISKRKVLAGEDRVRKRTSNPFFRGGPMFAFGLVLIVLVLVAAVGVMVGNTAPISGTTLFGFDVVGMSPVTFFLIGAALALVAAAGLSMILSGMKRSVRRRKEQKERVAQFRAQQQVLESDRAATAQRLQETQAERDRLAAQHSDQPTLLEPGSTQSDAVQSGTVQSDHSAQHNPTAQNNVTTHGASVAHSGAAVQEPFEVSGPGGGRHAAESVTSVSSGHSSLSGSGFRFGPSPNGTKGLFSRH